MSAILQLKIPSTLICPKCKNSTLIHRSFLKKFQCSHVEYDKPCGYQESDTSTAAFLRIFDYQITQTESQETDTEVSIRLSKIHDAVNQLLSDVDSWNKEDGKN